MFVTTLFGSAESRLLLLVLFQLFILWLVDEDGRKKLSLFQQFDLFGIRDEAEGIENLLLDGLQWISWIVGLQIELLRCGRNSSILFDSKMIRRRKSRTYDDL